MTLSWEEELASLKCVSYRPKNASVGSPPCTPVHMPAGFGGATVGLTQQE